MLASKWKFLPAADIPDPYPVDHGATLYNQLRQNDEYSRNNTRIEYRSVEMQTYGSGQNSKSLGIKQESACS